MGLFPDAAEWLFPGHLPANGGKYLVRPLNPVKYFFFRPPIKSATTLSHSQTARSPFPSYTNKIHPYGRRCRSRRRRYFRLHPGGQQLVPAPLPEIKVERSDLIFPGLLRQFLPVMNKLRTTRSQRRPDGGQQVTRIASVNGPHLPYPLGITPRTLPRQPQCILARALGEGRTSMTAWQSACLIISPIPGLSGQQDVPGFPFGGNRRIRSFSVGYNNRLSAMDLPQRGQRRQIQKVPDPFPVLCHPARADPLPKNLDLNRRRYPRSPRPGG